MTRDEMIKEILGLLEQTSERDLRGLLLFLKNLLR